ncbi:Ferrichrome outer membrane transporter/phage receptor [Achromobacter pestifer]|uniref:Ferrichrome outer membrane transporter/phage receptor n=2 Tax=Achromobacter pestifer TaxID=1353889 RepID=A0A6S6ZXZ9_9BURK|nr:Ferrichrome outer membrane transporter/phage receptor [Achromobacter pestifer]
MARRRTLDLIPLRSPPAHASAGAVFALRACLLGAMLGSPLLAMPAAQAQSVRPAPSNSLRSYNIPAGPLDRTLNQYASEAGVELSVDAALIQGKTSAGLHGRYGVQDGFAELLRGQGMRIVQGGGGAYSLRLAPASDAVDSRGATTLPAVTVTGSAESATGPVDGYLAKRSATGTKTDSSILETPQSISVVSADFIKEIGASRLKESLSYTPGINTAPWGADSRFDWTIIRGFDAQTPGYYLDGLQLRNNNSWAVWQTEVYGAERIEVLRGPTSVLYGQNGAGGMINVVSKRPTDEPLHEMEIQLGSNARRVVAADFSGPVDEDGKVLYRVTGLARDAELPASGLPNDRFFIAPALTIKPSSDTTLTLLSHYLRVRDGSSYGSFPEAGTLRSNPNGKFSPKTYVGEPDFDRFHQEQWMVGYLLEHRFNDTWTVRQNARYGYTSVDYRQVYVRGFETVHADTPDDPANFRLLSRYPFGSNENARLFTLDNQAQAKVRLGDWQHTLLVGLDYQHSRNYQATYNDGAVDPIDGYSPVHGSSVVTAEPWFDGTTKLAQTGLYLQDQIKWGNWVATLGGRYDRASADVNSNIDGSRTKVSEHNFSGRGGLVYLHPSGIAPYFSYAESFSPTATIDPVTNNPMRPETGRQYEVGIRYEPPGGTSRYSVAAFDLRRRNYITYTQDFLPKQTGEVQVRGLEFEASFRPVPQMNVVAAYTYTPKADVTASSTPSEVGKQMQAVSRNQFALWTDYRFQSGIKVGAGARYTGPNQGYAESASAKLPSYTLFDAMIGYQIQRWNLALNVRNVTNKAYLSNCSQGDCRYGELRTVLATATYRW